MEKISSNAALVWSEKEAHEKMKKKVSSILTHCMSNTLYFRIRNAREKKIKIPSKNKEIRNKFTGQF